MTGSESKSALRTENVEVDAIRLEAALGHKQELVRGFGLFSLTGLGIIIAKLVLHPPSCHGDLC